MLTLLKVTFKPCPFLVFSSKFSLQAFEVCSLLSLFGLKPFHLSRNFLSLRITLRNFVLLFSVIIKNRLRINGAIC